MNARNASVKIAPIGKAPHRYSYHLVHRAKKSRAWAEVASCLSGGDQCLAAGESALLIGAPLSDAQKEMIRDASDRPWIKHEFYSVFRVVDEREWAAMQASQFRQKKSI